VLLAGVLPKTLAIYIGLFSIIYSREDNKGKIIVTKKLYTKVVISLRTRFNLLDKVNYKELELLYRKSSLNIFYTILACLIIYSSTYP